MSEQDTYEPYTALSDERAEVLRMLLSSCTACRWVCDGLSRDATISYMHTHNSTPLILTILVGRVNAFSTPTGCFRVFVTDKDTHITEMWLLPFGEPNQSAAESAQVAVRI